MGEALKRVQDAYAEEITSNDPDPVKLKRLEDAIEKLGGGGGQCCHRSGKQWYPVCLLGD